jgi:eukaryotic-like serine/threonine-protein kinase
VIAGRYSLEREIGRGGMGTVWLGTDEVLDRQVALKQIGMLPGADGPDLARAEREAQLAARLNHPHVVAVFNLVADETTGARWLVMEYVEGTTLAQLIRQEGRLSPDDAAPMLWQAADALVAAHAEGIVHRDVKPSNILVDRDRQVKLTDFGIARIATDPSLTQTGLVTGSPAYLAPEVAAGHRGDEAADVWSLGATIFHVLSGRPPYEIGDHVLGGLYRIVNEEPPRPTDAGWLAPLLESTMVKDPARRWSMVQVRDFLGRAGSSTPVGGLLPFGAGAAEDAGTTQVVQPATNSDEPVPERQPAARGGSTPAWLLVAGLLALVAVLVVGLVLLTSGPDDQPAATGTTPEPSASPAERDSSPSRSAEPDGPTASGIESFIRDYVAAISTDPETAWPMLTPKFQRQSGGLEAYREFWSGVGQGEVLDIDANPDDLAVRYRVRFENFGTGRRPTVLDLVYEDGRYLIDGERTEGFVPAG